MVRISSGTVSVGGRDVTNLPPEEVARAGVGYVPQVDDVFAPLTVRENLEMGGYLLPSQAGSGADRAGAGGLPPARPACSAAAPGKLSGGERKMLAMGRVLMLEPGVFLLDEPTANLAPIDRHARCWRSTCAAWPPAAPRCSSWSSGPGPCSRSPTGPTSSAAARCGWRAPRRSCRQAPSSSIPSWAAATATTSAPPRAERAAAAARWLAR